MKRMTLLLAACACAAGAQAQTTVYKCNPRAYSETPCSSRIVRTYDAPVETPRKSPEVVAHRLPGESDQELATRRHRIRLGEADRHECARLDKKIPFEAQRAKDSPHQEEVDDAQDSLAEARKRFKQLRC
jgi:hypothetical protein